MADTTSVQVALRIRPLVPSEIAKGCQDILEVYPEQQQIRIKNSDKAFTYNNVFDHNTNQSDFYDKCVKHLIDNLFKGYNVTILAYGQTGSGKTHSMGTAYDGEGEMGVIPRAVTDIFNFVKDNFGFDFSVNVSFMELYQETLFDLLAKKPRDQCVVEIREDTKGIVIPGLTEEPVNSAREALDCLIRGSQGRATASTNMNSQSSRSHAIYTINIHMQKKDDSNSNKTAKFHLVDLAGSERSKKTGATGQTFKEGVNINKGLLALGNVISALGDEKLQNNFISYRDSNLTRLLKDSLGGNSITLMIACVSPADYNLEETISTLRYADRARKIKNKPIVNQDPKTAEINKLQKIIQQLRLELVGQGGPIICPAELELLRKEVNELKTKNRILNVKLASSLNDNAMLFERVHIIETANEELSAKVNKLKEEYNVTLTNLNCSIENSDVTAIKENVIKLESIQASLREINSQQERTLKDIRRHESTSYRPANTDNDSISENDINEKQESHTAQQIALSTELQEITRQLRMKEELAECIVSNNLYAIDQTLIVECETKIATLESEKEELLQQLKNAQNSGPTSKVSEQRRKRVQELESQIQDLKKKVVEQARLIKLKEKDEVKIKQLHNEIQTMKHTKVDLMRKMRSESDKFRTWKLQREREVQKLKDQDRKRQNQIVKMEIMHTRQQNVLKRKVEEAAAINKRLKDALAKRKAANDMKTGKIERIADWIQQELEIHSSTLEAQITLKSLLEDRATLHKQLEEWKNDEHMVNNEEYRQLEEDIQLRSIQIQDLQQKVLDSQEESRAQTRWDNIQTMAEAKLALKTLFESVSDIKKCTFSAENKVAELEQTIESLTKKNLEQLNTIKEMEVEFSKNQCEYEEKISVLLRRVEVEDHDDRLKQILEIQQQKIEHLQNENDNLAKERDSLANEKDQLKTENETLAEKLKTINDTAKLAAPTIARKRVKKEGNSMLTDVTEMYILDENEASFVVDDEKELEKDPDWRKTPLGKKIEKIKSKESGKDTLKRNSLGGCNCKGNCSSRNCGCRKTTRNCGTSCKCKDDHCTNRNNSLNDSEGKSVGSDSEDSFKVPVYKHRIPELRDQSIELPRRTIKRRNILKYPSD